MSCSISGVYNISCDQGATFSRSITWTDSARNPYNLTDYTARMHVRSNVTSDTTVITLTTANSRISLGGAAGTVTLTIAATDTANLAAGLYVYDLELVSPTNVVTRLIEGNFKIKAEVTR